MKKYIFNLWYLLPLLAFLSFPFVHAYVLASLWVLFGLASYIMVAVRNEQGRAIGRRLQKITIGGHLLNGLYFSLSGILTYIVYIDMCREKGIVPFLHVWQKEFN